MVSPNRVQAGIAEQHFKVRARSRIALENSVHVLPDGLEKRNHKQRTASAIGFQNEHNQRLAGRERTRNALNLRPTISAVPGHCCLFVADPALKPWASSNCPSGASNFKASEWWLPTGSMLKRNAGARANPKHFRTCRKN